MTSPDFLDTNVVVYAIDDRDPVKQQKSQRLLAVRARPFALSAQVLGEYYVTVTRKLPRPLSAQDAAESVAALSTQHVVPLDTHLVARAVQTSRDHQLSYWDALIVEAAVAAGCERILTEDLTDGQVIRGVEIVNPYLSQSTT